MSDVPLDVVKLDLDRKWTGCHWQRWTERVAETLGALGIDKPRSVEVRQTKRGFHVLIELAEPLPNPFAIVAVQAMLGSDGVREAFNLNRCITQRPGDWNVLFERKVRADGTTKVTQARVDYARVLARTLSKWFGEPVAVEWTPAPS